VLHVLVQAHAVPCLPHHAGQRRLAHLNRLPPKVEKGLTSAQMHQVQSPPRVLNSRRRLSRAIGSRCLAARAFSSGTLSIASLPCLRQIPFHNGTVQNENWMRHGGKLDV
jgi:hypothetical protein